MNTTRILDIIGYQATESDSKRLSHAVSRFGGKMQASVIAESKAGSIRASEIGDGLVGVFGTDNAYAIEKKIDELGYGVP